MIDRALYMYIDGYYICHVKTNCFVVVLLAVGAFWLVRVCYNGELLSDWNVCAMNWRELESWSLTGSG